MRLFDCRSSLQFYHLLIPRHISSLLRGILRFNIRAKRYFWTTIIRVQTSKAGGIQSPTRCQLKMQKKADITAKTQSQIGFHHDLQVAKQKSNISCTYRIYQDRVISRDIVLTDIREVPQNLLLFNSFRGNLNWFMISAPRSNPCRNKNSNKKSKHKVLYKPMSPTTR